MPGQGEGGRSRSFTEKMTWELTDGGEGSHCRRVREQGFSLEMGKETKGQIPVWEKPCEQDEAKWLTTRRVNEMGLPGACLLGAGCCWVRPVS